MKAGLPTTLTGKLDSGLAKYLTTWSAARNVTAKGQGRVNLNSASAQDITKTVSEITAQEAQSIVEHRRKKKFATIADLLDVELVTKTTEQSKSTTTSRDKAPPKKTGPASRRSGGSSTRPAKPQPAKGDSSKSKTSTKSTGKKAFDVEKFHKIADYFSTSDKEVLRSIVNINTAPWQVLACVPGIDDTLALQITRSREGQTTAFETTADLLDVPGMSVSIFRQACPHLSARSDIFSVRSFGVVGNGDTYCCVTAVIDRTEDEARLRYWYESE